MNTKPERRYFKAAEIRVTREAGKQPTIEGYAAKFDCMSEDLGGFCEKIEKGAFSQALKTSDTRALFNHDSNLILGRTSAGTLELHEDEIGLHMKIMPPDTQTARDLMVSIERGDITQQSFGFSVEKDTWEDKDGKVTRTLNVIANLFDVSPVTFPAYPDTEVAVRSLQRMKQSGATPGNQGETAPEKELRKLKLSINQKGV